MEILTQLRQSTGPLHTRIEELPICKAMLAGAVDRSEYLRLITSLYHLHAAYETWLARSPEVAAAWPRTPSRSAALSRDLLAFGVELDVAPDWVMDWVDAIHGCNHQAAWAGAGYVFEGSRMGSRILVRTVSRSLRLEPRPGVGLDYHLDHGDDPVGNWKRVMEALKVFANSEKAGTAMTTAAVITFETLFAIHESASEVDRTCEAVK